MKRAKSNQRNSGSQGGFTLTELLVVMVILSLIAAAITPQVMGRLDRSKVRASKIQLQTLSSAIDMYKIDAGQYPSQQEGLRALIMRPQTAEVWDGPYVKSMNAIIDSWNNPIEYRLDRSSYQLISHGADGIPGGEDLEADLIFPDLDPGLLN